MASGMLQGAGGEAEAEAMASILHTIAELSDSEGVLLFIDK